MRPAWRKTGAATQFHEAQLTGCPKRIAQLLIDPDHPEVGTLYD